MRIVSLVGLVAFGAFIAGCGGPQLSQAQLNAIETRQLDAGMDASFTAASGALFDAGYTVAMSDRHGGLITGTKAKDRTQDRLWWGEGIHDTQYTLSIQMRPDGENRTTVRIKTAVNGELVVDKQAIDQVWVLMQRQVLMTQANAGDPPAGSAGR